MKIPAYAGMTLLGWIRRFTKISGYGVAQPQRQPETSFGKATPYFNSPFSGCLGNANAPTINALPIHVSIATAVVCCSANGSLVPL